MLCSLRRALAFTPSTSNPCNRKRTYLSASSTFSNNESIHPSLLPIHALTSQVTNLELPPHKSTVKAYCLSDLHADGPDDSDQWSWITQRCLPPHQNDVFHILIVPGDLANSMPALRRSFRFLASHWDAVCYCVGNHEAWVKEEESTGEDIDDNEEENNNNNKNNDTNEEEEEDTTGYDRTSVDQLVDVLTAAREEGVHVGPVCVPYHHQKHLWMVPLQSFYHSSWDTEPDLQDPALVAAEQRRSFRKRWNDFRNMKWPTRLTSEHEFTRGSDGRGGSWALATAFGELNRNILNHFANQNKDSTSRTILSFSHYVPRIELSPEKRFLIDPGLARVIGSDRLEQDIRQLKPNLHMFGHTHIPIGMNVDGIRYAQWPLGYPREAERQCRPVVHAGPMLVFDSDTGVPSAIDAEKAHWSRHYQLYRRDPNNLEPAPWLRERLERIGRRTR
jgi:hypothetical protein